MAEKKKKVDVKITLLGNSGVGKTCIIGRYTSNVFNESSPSTAGGSYSQKFIKVGDTEVQLDIWDTGGQEKYRSLGKHFYKDAYIVCLVYDICISDSFQAIKQIWYPDLKKFGEKFTVLAVVGNKCDKYEEEKVKEDEARAFAQEIGAEYFLTSAKNGDGIDILFQTLAEKYLGPEFISKIEEVKKEKGESVKITKVAHSDKNVKKKSCC